MGLLPEASRQPSLPENLLPRMQLASEAGSGRDRQLAEPTVLSAPPIKLGLRGRGTWRLWVAAVTTCEWGERRQAVAVPKKRGR